MIHNYEIPNNDEEIGVVHKDITVLLDRNNLDSKIKGGPYKKNIMFFSGKDFWDREEWTNIKWFVKNLFDKICLRYE